MANAASAKLTLIVAGDVVVDHHLYEGERPRPTTEGHRGVRVIREVGGAATLRSLIDEVMLAGCKQTETENRRALEAWYSEWLKGDDDPPEPRRPWEPAWEVILGITTPPEDAPSNSDHAYAVLRPLLRHRSNGEKSTKDAKEERVWRIAEPMGYGEPTGSEPSPCEPKADLAPACVLVLDDGGFQFRKRLHEACWHLPANHLPRWVLLKMSGPVARGDLWNELTRRFDDRLVCLVSAADLRHEKLSLGPGLSWERTVEELSIAMGSVGEFRALRRCAHLIVTFSTDGALWVDRTDHRAPVAKLFFDAGGADGEFVERLPGEMIGLQTVMAASLARALAEHATADDPLGPPTQLKFDEAIARGLTAMRDLMEFGHGSIDQGVPSGYPVSRIRDILLKPGDGFAEANIPWPLIDKLQPDELGRWMIIEMLQHPPGSTVRPGLFGVANDLLTRGISPVLKHFPHAKFGELVTADRQEIETLRNIRRLMFAYKEDRSATKPLSIGVFGPPGAGKSFGVRQLANEAFGKAAWLEFNLSQFTPPGDLIGALLQVGDQVLRGTTPVVFWDEFDSRQFEWLQYLLAPMQDGRFQDGQISHPLGKSVFIFAGGTNENFAAFERQADTGDAAAVQFMLRKGPDFRSRLDAYYDVLGPNQRELPLEKTFPEPRRVDPDDQGYVLRRALLIHSMLKSDGKPLADIDEGLVNALLRVPRYTNGARSLEKLVIPLRPNRNQPVRRSWLPAPSQIAMHVDPPEDFSRLLAMKLDSNWLEERS